MYRDGAMKSLWQAEVKIFDVENAMPDHYDVIIVGAGITGLSCAINLQRAGKRCAIVEARNIGFGTSGGTTAHLNNFFDTTYSDVIKDFGLEEAQLLANAAKEAIHYIKNNVEHYQIDCTFEEHPGYLFATDDDQKKMLDNIVEGAQKVGVVMQEKHSNPFGIPFVKIVEIPGQAQFHPLKYIVALAEAFLKIGGAIWEDCRVLNVTADKEDDSTKVETSKGVMHCDNVVYATHIPLGTSHLHLTNAPYRSYAMALKLKDHFYPQAMGYDLYDPYHYYRSQVVDGEQYLIAGGEDHKTGHVENTDECFDKLESYVRGFFNVESVAYKWSSQYYEPADGLPSIGKLSGKKNLFVATGYSGNGMIFGTIAAIVICDLIVKQKSPYEKLFNPNRIKPVAGFSNFMKEGADVVKTIIEDKLSTERVSTLAAIQKEEAQVVKFDDVQLAVYRDHGGELHVLNSSCTHLHCNVHWNNAEKSWDCPCHGSRFGLKGDVLTSPAVKDLTRFS